MSYYRVRISIFPWIGLYAMTFFLISCSKGRDDTENAEYTIKLSFIHKAGQESVEFDTIRYFNAFGNRYSIIALKYFVSDFVFHRSDGDSISASEIHYVDATDPATLTFIPDKKVMTGNYSGVSFTFGIESSKNTTGRFLNPPENKMEWPGQMGGGYHYMKLEGKFDSAGLIKNYQAHTGPLMGKSYCIRINLLSSAFSISTLQTEIILTLDLNRWWKTPNILDLNTISGIMGDESYQRQLQENGADVFTISSIR